MYRTKLRETSSDIIVVYGGIYYVFKCLEYKSYISSYKRSKNNKDYNTLTFLLWEIICDSKIFVPYKFAAHIK